jgi:hypothetical protein
MDREKKNSFPGNLFLTILSKGSGDKEILWFIMWYNSHNRLREMCDYKSLLKRKVLFDMSYVSQS